MILVIVSSAVHSCFVVKLNWNILGFRPKERPRVVDKAHNSQVFGQLLFPVWVTINWVFGFCQVRVMLSFKTHFLFSFYQRTNVCNGWMITNPWFVGLVYIQDQCLSKDLKIKHHMTNIVTNITTSPPLLLHHHNYHSITHHHHINNMFIHF